MERARIRSLVKAFQADPDSDEVDRLELVENLHQVISRATALHNFSAVVAEETGLLDLLLFLLKAGPGMPDMPIVPLPGAPAPSGAHERPERKYQRLLLEMFAGDDKEEWGLIYWPSSRGALVPLALRPEADAFAVLAQLLRNIAAAPPEAQLDSGGVLAAAARVLVRLVLSTDGLYAQYGADKESVRKGVESGALPALVAGLRSYIAAYLLEAGASGGAVAAAAATGGHAAGGAAAANSNRRRHLKIHDHDKSSARQLPRSTASGKQSAFGHGGKTQSQRRREVAHRQQVAAAAVTHAVMLTVGYICQALTPAELRETGVAESVLEPAVSLMAGLAEQLAAAEKLAAEQAAAAAAAAAQAAGAAAAGGSAAASNRPRTGTIEHQTVNIRLSYVVPPGPDPDTDPDGAVAAAPPPAPPARRDASPPPVAAVTSVLVRALDGLLNCIEGRADGHVESLRQQRLIAFLAARPAAATTSSTPSPLRALMAALSRLLRRQEEAEEARRRQLGRGGSAGASRHAPLPPGGAAALAAASHGAAQHEESGRARGKLHAARDALAPYKVLFDLQGLTQQAAATAAAALDDGVGSAAADADVDDGQGGAALSALASELGDLSTAAVRATLLPTLLARGELHQAVDTAGALEDLFRHLPQPGQAALAGVLADAAAQPAAPLGLVVAVAAAAGALTSAAAGAAIAAAEAQHAGAKSGTSGPRQKKQPQPTAAQVAAAVAGAGLGAGPGSSPAPSVAGAAQPQLSPRGPSAAQQHLHAAVAAVSVCGTLSHASSYASLGGLGAGGDDTASLMGTLPAAAMVGRMRELTTHHKAHHEAAEAAAAAAAKDTADASAAAEAAGGAGSAGAGAASGRGTHAPVGLVEAVLVGLAENLQSFLTAAVDLLPPSEAVAAAEEDGAGGEGGAHSGHVDELVGLVCRCTQRFQERLPVVLQHLQAHLHVSPADDRHGGAGGGGHDAAAAAEAAGLSPFAAAAAAADGGAGAPEGGATTASAQGQDLLVSTACVAATRVLESCASSLAVPSSPSGAATAAADGAAAAAAADAGSPGEQAAAALRILATIIKSPRAPLQARVQASAAAAQALKRLLLSTWTADGSDAAAAAAPAPAASLSAAASGGGGSSSAAGNGCSSGSGQPHPLLAHEATEAAQACLDALFGVLSDAAVHAADPDLFEDDVCAGLAVPLAELVVDVPPPNPLAAALDCKHSLVVAARALKALVKSVPLGQLTGDQETLVRCFGNAHDDGLRHSAFNLDLLFAEGAVGALLRRMHDTPPDQPLEEEALQFFASLTDWVPSCRARLRDVGLLKRVSRRMEQPGCGGFELVLLVSICKGMSESEALHTFMKELGVARALAAKLVGDTEAAAAAAGGDLTLLPVGSPGGLDALLTLANLNGGTTSPDDQLCQDLIVKHDISAQIAQFAAEAAASTRGLATFTFPDGTWSIYDLPSLLTSCLSLTRTAVNCERLAQHGLLPTLLCVLRSANAAAAAAKAAAAPPPASAGAAAAAAAAAVTEAAEAAAGDSDSGSSGPGGGCSKHVDPALGVVVARTLFNMSQVVALHPALKEAGVQELLKACLARDDLRVVDAARGTLLQLGELTDTAATRALKASQAAEEAAGAKAKAKAAADAAAAAADAAAADAAAGGAPHIAPGAFSADPPLYDVFLSHKRTDARDFARALWNLLVSNGYTVFLDFEFKQELGSLEEMVGRCTHFLFIMTDNVFKSEWCIKELVAAVKHGVNIVLMIKDGARWADVDGNPTCDFPPPHLLRSLPAEVQHVFSKKPVVHNDEYYRAFVEALFDKLYRPPVLESPSRMASLDEVMAMQMDAIANGMAVTPDGTPVDLNLLDPAAAAAAAAAGLVPGAPGGAAPPPHSAHPSSAHGSAHGGGASAHPHHSAVPHHLHSAQHGHHGGGQHSAHLLHHSAMPGTAHHGGGGAGHGHGHHGPHSAHSAHSGFPHHSAMPHHQGLPSAHHNAHHGHHLHSAHGHGHHGGPGSAHSAGHHSHHGHHHASAHSAGGSHHSAHGHSSHHGHHGQSPHSSAHLMHDPAHAAAAAAYAAAYAAHHHAHGGAHTAAPHGSAFPALVHHPASAYTMIGNPWPAAAHAAQAAIMLSHAAQHHHGGSSAHGGAVSGSESAGPHGHHHQGQDGRSHSAGSTAHGGGHGGGHGGSSATAAELAAHAAYQAELHRQMQMHAQQAAQQQQQQQAVAEGGGEGAGGVDGAGEAAKQGGGVADGSAAAAAAASDTEAAVAAQQKAMAAAAAAAVAAAAAAGGVSPPPHILFQHAISDPGAFSSHSHHTRTDSSSGAAAMAAELGHGRTHGVLGELQAELAAVRRDLAAEVAGLGRSLQAGQQELRSGLGGEVAAAARMVSAEVRALVLETQAQVHALKVELGDVRQELGAGRQAAAEMRGLVAQVLEGMSALIQRNVQLESLMQGGNGGGGGGNSHGHGHGHPHGISSSNSHGAGHHHSHAAASGSGLSPPSLSGMSAAAATAVINSSAAGMHRDSSILAQLLAGGGSNSGAAAGGAAAGSASGAINSGGGGGGGGGSNSGGLHRVNSGGGVLTPRRARLSASCAGYGAYGNGGGGGGMELLAADDMIIIGGGGGGPNSGGGPSSGGGPTLMMMAPNGGGAGAAVSRSAHSATGLLPLSVTDLAGAAGPLPPAAPYSPRLSPIMLSVAGAAATTTVVQGGGGGGGGGGGAGSGVVVGSGSRRGSETGLPPLQREQGGGPAAMAMDSPRGRRIYVSQPLIIKDGTAVEPAGHASPLGMGAAAAGGGGGSGRGAGLAAAGAAAANGAGIPSSLADGITSSGVVLPPLAAAAVLHHHNQHLGAAAAAAPAPSGLAAAMVAADRVGPGGGGEGGRGVVAGGGFQMRPPPGMPQSQLRGKAAKA
ncbi:hypothetical protein HXX76_009223 [Chlamydomonas incerta]|uniref:TIR domain-containing protein n=1 Tax=Chlamydomonas incerta TaxID=51695 RepID=A0A835VWA0_CHLIN|nr:hypothetical protein HXX76_009223 [Chlamydomonas incerta]|eukprot:KAG2431727.1 hypothetical protein HXX76_009223 [Chlamydomonas incerta]